MEAADMWIRRLCRVTNRKRLVLNYFIVAILTMCLVFTVSIFTLSLTCCITGIHSGLLDRTIRESGPASRLVLADTGSSNVQSHPEESQWREALRSPEPSRTPVKSLLDPSPLINDDQLSSSIEVDTSQESRAPKQYSGDESKSGILRNPQNGTKKRPQAIIIGVKKGGTRALLEFIRIHPDVRAPGPETHFFDKNYDKGLEWYRQQMPSTIDGQITVEKTPSYFVTKGVPARIYNMSKDILLIVVVRDPVTRAVSDYTQALSKRTDVKSFEEMAFLDNSTRLVDTSWGAVRIGVYAKHLEKWLQYFPLKQMHFVNGEKLITDPAGEMSRVQDFLGLKRVITDKHFYFNATKGFPCLKKPEGSGSPHCLGKTKGRSHPKIEEDVLERLRDFFRPFNHKFYKMTGIDFGWS